MGKEREPILTISSDLSLIYIEAKSKASKDGIDIGKVLQEMRDSGLKISEEEVLSLVEFDKAVLSEYED